MPSRSTIVSTARSFLGVRWRHQGRSRDGCDCVGLVAAVADELGMLPGDFSVPPYRREPGPELLVYFDRYLDRIPIHSIRDGSIVLFAFMGQPYHAGIMVNLSSQAIVHAFATKRKVVTDYLDNPQMGRKLVRAYDYREVYDG